MRLITIMTLFCLMIVSGCTENPLFDDAVKSSDGSVLKGRVTLSDGTTPDGIYVWLEALNLGTFTDKNGEYIISLPAAQAQPGGGLSGEFTVYYYIGNYKYETRNLLFLRGVVKFGEADVSEKGELNSVILDLFADLNVVMDVNTFRVDAKSEFLLKYQIDNVFDGFFVEIFKDPRIPNTIANIFFTPIGEPIENSILYSTFDRPTQNWISHSMTPIFNDSTQRFNLPVGEYYVMPYLHIKQDVPEELIASLGGITGEFDYRFLNIPYKRSVPILRVVE